MGVYRTLELRFTVYNRVVWCVYCNVLHNLRNSRPLTNNAQHTGKYGAQQCVLCCAGLAAGGVGGGVGRGIRGVGLGGGIGGLTGLGGGIGGGLGAGGLSHQSKGLMLG